MAQQLAFNGVIVKKHNDLIRARMTKVSLHSSRILTTLSSSIRTNDTKLSDEYSFKVSDIFPDDSGYYYNAIKESCRELLETRTEIEDIETEHFKGINVFRSIEYLNGFVIAKFNDDMQPLLIGLKEHFTTYYLMEYIQLPSGYSQKIYEILRSWKSKPEVTLKLDYLHSFLGVPDYLKERYGDFRRSVLEKAHKDLHEFSGLRYEWEAIKKGRRVDSIRFVFTAPRIKEVKAEQVKLVNKENAKKNNDLLQVALQCFEKKKVAKGKCFGDKNKTCEVCLNLIQEI